jgi:uncharacterized cupin superfamily protein
VSVAHFDEAAGYEFALGHLRSRWSSLGEAVGSVGVGARRIEVPAGGWSTPAHEHGRGEEIFYVLAGTGLSWQNGRVAPIRAGDCIVYLPRRGAHTVHALEPLELIAFGPRFADESIGFPRLGCSLVGRRAVESSPTAIDGQPFQFIRESELGPPELPDPIPPAPRPPTIINLDDVEPVLVDRPRVARARRNLGLAAGSVSTGLQHVEVLPGKESAPPHCHSVEEELFVVLSGGGVIILGDEERPVGRGSVVARPPGTAVAHCFRGGESGLTYLAYGTRDPSDVCYYPRSNKVCFRGVNLMARLERLDYWHGED